MAFTQGTVIIARDPYESAESGRRPFVILNNNRHPYHGKQYVAVALSTKNRDGSVPVPERGWERGAPERQSYAQPWSVCSVPAGDVAATVGRLNDDLFKDVFDAALTYIVPDSATPADMQDASPA